jgi:hypothetical protein
LILKVKGFLLDGGMGDEIKGGAWRLVKEGAEDWGEGGDGGDRGQGFVALLEKGPSACIRDLGGGFALEKCA